jgi:voltage-gated potassium channel
MIPIVSLIRKGTDTILELLAIYVGLLVVCALLFSFFEHRTIAESFYWAYITATTTGYGDVTPKTLGGHLTTLFLTHASLFVIIPLLIVQLNSTFNPDRNAWTDEEQEEIKRKIAETEATSKEILELLKHRL